MPSNTHRRKTSRGRKRAKKTPKRSVRIQRSGSLQTGVTQAEAVEARRAHSAKLDALLLLSTERHQTAPIGRMSKRGPRSAKVGVTSSLSQLLSAQSDAAAALQVLAVQLHRNERKRLLEEDLLSVLVDVSEQAPLEQ